MLTIFIIDSCATLINLKSPLYKIESLSLELFMADQPDIINPSTPKTPGGLDPKTTVMQVEVEVYRLSSTFQRSNELLCFYPCNGRTFYNIK